MEYGQGLTIEREGVQRECGGGGTFPMERGLGSSGGGLALLVVRQRVRRGGGNLRGGRTFLSTGERMVGGLGERGVLVRGEGLRGRVVLRVGVFDGGRGLWGSHLGLKEWPDNRMRTRVLKCGCVGLQCCPCMAHKSTLD